MSASRTSDLWWKNGVIYCLDDETFLDTDGDGTGDLPGLTDRVDYLAGIGVTCTSPNASPAVSLSCQAKFCHANNTWTSGW